MKRAFDDRLVLVAAFLAVLFAATVVAAIPIYADAVAQSSLRDRLSHSPVKDVNLQVTVNVFGGGSDRRLDSQVTAIGRDVFLSTGVAIHRSGKSEPFGTGGRIVVFGFFDGLRRHARLLAGRWPGSRETPVEVTVSAPVARGLRLRVGDRVRARNQLDENQVVSARVVGIYRVERPSSAYWWDEPLATAGVDAGEYGPFVTTRRSFFMLGLQDAELRWRLEPDLRRLTIDQATDLRRKLVPLPRRLNAGRPSGQQIEVDTNLPAILGAATRSLHRARAGVLVPSIQLALLAVYGLLFTAGLLIQRRLLVTERLRLRGATAAQIVTMALMEASLIALPAVVVAPWIAAGSLRSLNYVGPLAGIGFRLDPHVGVSAYALAAGAGLVCAAGLALPALRACRLGVASERKRLPLAGLAQRAHLDLVVAVLAALGYWQLRHYHGVLVANRGGLGIDPFLVAAPAILLLAGALLSLRVVPLAARLVERAVASTRGVVAALGLRQLARRPRGYAQSVLLLVLAVAIGVFAATYSRTWQRSQVDQARHAAGAELLVEPSEGGSAPPVIDLASSYRALGIREALPAATDSLDFAVSGGGPGNLLALDARRAPAVVNVRSDFASRPVAELLRPLGEGRGRLAALRLPGRPTRLALTVRLTIERPAPTAGTDGVYEPRPLLFLYLQDGDGLIHLYRLRDPSPGKARRFVLDLGHRLPNGRLARPRYPLAVVALELDLGVPYLVPRRATLVASGLEVSSGADGSWRRVSLGGDRGWRAFSTGFSLPYQLSAVEGVSSSGGSVRAVLGTGSYLYQGPQPPGTEFFLRPGRDSLLSVPPVLASDSFLKEVNTSVGQVVPLVLSGGTHKVRIVGSFRRFPTLDPAVPAVLVDLPTYLGFTFAGDGDVVRPSQWWLEAGGDATALAARLLAAPFASIAVVSRAERQRALLEDAIPLGVMGALTLGFVVAAAFAAIGFAASSAVAARQRTLEFAVLRSLGLRARQLSGWITFESALVVVISLLGGTALGLIVSWLVLPYVALGASAARPVPPVRVELPWETFLWLELALLGTLAAIAAVQVKLVQRLQLAPALRGGEEAVAP